MSNTYIIKINIAKGDNHSFSYLAVTNGHINRWSNPIGFCEYLTKEQAEKVAARYSAFWRENIKGLTLEAVSILSLNEAIYDYYQWMLKMAANKHTTSDSIIKTVKRDHPLK